MAETTQGTPNADEVEFSPPVEASHHVNAARATAEPVALVEPEVQEQSAERVEPRTQEQRVEQPEVVEPVETKYPVTTPVALAEPTPAVAEPSPVAVAAPTPVAETTVAPADVPVSVEPITASSAPETIALAETTPEAHRPQEVVIVDAPVAPKKKSNRLAGLLFALLASVVFTALFALAVVVIGYVVNGNISISFLAQPSFYFPVLIFFLALVLVVAIVNNAGWWTYIITSVLVGAAVYFGTAGILLLSAGFLDMSRQEANAFYFGALVNPLTIAAALIAREVAIWTGAILGARGRKVRARNVEAREAYEREQAELIPTATA